MAKRQQVGRELPAELDAAVRDVFDTFWRSQLIVGGHWQFDLVKRELFDYYELLRVLVGLHHEMHDGSTPASARRTAEVLIDDVREAEQTRQRLAAAKTQLEALTGQLRAIEARNAALQELAAMIREDAGAAG